MREKRHSQFSKRRQWDSNPRALADNRISSAARYDHFDMSPNSFYYISHSPGGSSRNIAVLPGGCQNHVVCCSHRPGSLTVE